MNSMNGEYLANKSSPFPTYTAKLTPTGIAATRKPNINMRKKNVPPRDARYGRWFGLQLYINVNFFK